MDRKLVRPSEAYLEAVSAYRQAFLDAGDSMDGCGPLRRFEDPADWLAEVRRYEDPATVPADKVEEAIKRIPGVNDAKVNFMMQKFTLDAADERFDAVLREAVAVGKKIEPDFSVEL